MISKYSLSTGREQEFKTLFRHIAEPNNAKIVSIHNFAVPINANIFSNFPKILYAVFLSIDKVETSKEFTSCVSISMSIWNC